MPITGTDAVRLSIARARVLRLRRGCGRRLFAATDQDQESIARVRARVQQGVTTADRRRAEALIVSGPRPFGRYLAKLRESGELAAVAYMLEEATSLSAALPAECLQSRRAE